MFLSTKECALLQVRVSDIHDIHVSGIHDGAHIMDFLIGLHECTKEAGAKTIVK